MRCNPDDTDALIALWLDNEESLRGYVNRRVCDASAAEDIIQDSYLKAHQNFSELASPARATGWLFRITANTVIDYYRRRRRFSELPDDLASPETGPDETVQLARCVRPLIDTLPAMYREVLIASELDGLAQQDVAIRSGISLSGAKSRIQRGRIKLKQAIRECCDVNIGQDGITGYERRDAVSGSAAVQCQS